MSDPRHRVAHLPVMAPVPCPCGSSRRAFATEDSPLSVHLVDIAIDARTHHHQRTTETYVVLDCAADAYLECDGERVPVAPLTAVQIRPGCRHRAVGRMRLLNIAVPVFDPADEILAPDGTG